MLLRNPYVLPSSQARPARQVLPAQATRTQHGPLRVCALLNGGRSRTGVQEQFTKFKQRYEQQLLPSGVGALAVTSYCVARGQSPATAAVITVVATVTALVLNEVLFSSDDMSS